MRTLALAARSAVINAEGEPRASMPPGWKHISGKKLDSMIETAKRDIELGEQRVAAMRDRAQLLVFSRYHRLRKLKAVGQVIPLLILMLLLWAGVAEAVVTRYTTSVARGATGTACTQGNRCTNVQAVSASSAGDTISMEGNTSANPYVYSNANDIIKPLTGQDGVTVRCEVAGGCLIDGQFARIPVSLLSGNDNWIIEDLNVKNGTTNLVSIRGNNNTIRRVVGWDIQFNTTASGAALFACYSPSVGTVFEDVAGFGTGTWIFTHTQDKTGSCTFRRAWARFEGTAVGNNGGAAFGGLFYKALSTTCDNCIGEYFPNIGLTSYTASNITDPAFPDAECPGGTCTDGVPPVPNGPMNQNRWLDSGDTTCTTNQSLCNMDAFVGGSFLYVRSTANMSRFAMSGGSCPFTSGCTLMYSGAGRIGGGMTFQNVLWWVDPSHAQFANIRALSLQERLTSPDNFFTNVSTVAGVANIIDSVDSSGGGTSGVWVATSLVHAASLTALNAANANPWTGTAGANLCYSYQNRVRQDGTGGTTAQPLWPWPMNQRIIDATGIAGAYSGPCTGCVGTWPTRTAVNVTTTVEGMLGTIPSTCRTDITPTTFPAATGFSPATLSTF